MFPPELWHEVASLLPASSAVKSRLLHHCFAHAVTLAGLHRTDCCFGCRLCNHIYTLLLDRCRDVSLPMLVRGLHLSTLSYVLPRQVRTVQEAEAVQALFAFSRDDWCHNSCSPVLYAAYRGSPDLVRWFCDTFAVTKENILGCLNSLAQSPKHIQVLDYLYSHFILTDRDISHCNSEVKRWYYSKVQQPPPRPCLPTA